MNTPVNKLMNALALYGRYVSASLRAQAQYPAATLMLTAGHFAATAIEFLGVFALFNRFGAVGGWSFGEAALFYGLVNIMFALADLLGRGFDVFGTDFVRTGAFDRLLLRPRTTVLQLAGHEVRLSRLGRLLQGFAVLILASVLAPIGWDAATIAIALWAIAGGVALFVGILVLQATLAFWTVESLEIVNVLTYGGVQAAQYPLNIYAAWFRRLLTFGVPLACVAYYPVVAILKRTDPLGAPDWLLPLTPLAGFAFLALSFLAWRSGVARYASTGS
jgi:ABC-2 type transport system permease protein